MVAHPTLAHAMQRLQIELLLVLIGTKRILGRCTASAMASASRKSLCWSARKASRIAQASIARVPLLAQGPPQEVRSLQDSTPIKSACKFAVKAAAVYENISCGSLPYWFESSPPNERRSCPNRSPAHVVSWDPSFSQSAQLGVPAADHPLMWNHGLTPQGAFR